MAEDRLAPRLDRLTQEYVLVQAWKKTAAYIRNHNWYSDTLELDRAAVDLPRFLGDISERMKEPHRWNSDPLRLVPAPKSQQWQINSENNAWMPRDGRSAAAGLRPLAHVSLRDQVAATALLLCLADRVETSQGDPREHEETSPPDRVLSFGNRLFCDKVGDNLQHRWGSGKLYRGYYQDYATFLLRPESKSAALKASGRNRIIIIQSDLNKFYDRVRPQLLAQKLRKFSRPNDDPQFWIFAANVLNWTWNRRDSAEISNYASKSGIVDFNQIALPQGLVAAGFFANVVLVDLDSALRQSLSQEIMPGIILEDASRYVDDLRLVLTASTDISEQETLSFISKWLEDTVEASAAGLRISRDKTRAYYYGQDQHAVVHQSRKMAKIQNAISGGFDAIRGEEILESVQGLIRAQQRFSEAQSGHQTWSFTPVPDVKDATVARFAAARFRKTYRALRPLLDDATGLQTIESPLNVTPFREVKTWAELDNEARAFALGLIDDWVKDPSNVRLLRIGLDLWPAEDVLDGVLGLLRPFTEKGGRRKAPRRVAWYCLAEIFRAGATETGFVSDKESFPSGIDITSYRNALAKEAERLAALPSSRLPWYLKQQVLLYLAVHGRGAGPITRIGTNLETRRYRELILFLNGSYTPAVGVDFAILAILARRAFRGQQEAEEIAIRNINARQLEHVAERDPTFANELIKIRPELSDQLSPRFRADLSLNRETATSGWSQLASIVLESPVNGILRNERAILTFGLKFLKAWQDIPGAPVRPSDVWVSLNSPEDSSSEFEIKILPSRIAPTGSIYAFPTWCRSNERWRFSLGYLLRFILTAQTDFTKSIRKNTDSKVARYRAPDGHWYQRHYGLFNGHSGFGDDWLPISDWTERLLSALLRWPGCIEDKEFASIGRGVSQAITLLEERRAKLAGLAGSESDPLMLTLRAPAFVKGSSRRKLHACVVQTVIPNPQDFASVGLTLSSPAFRRKHRNHLSAALAAVNRMLHLRETHNGSQRLDWLILPELSVHPDDIATHLIPFARANKTIILAGLTYQELFPNQPLINSAVWIIPTNTVAQGTQLIVRRQGKAHLANLEQALNHPNKKIQGFRPCQWLVEYGHAKAKPLRLTASVCYDATDLSLMVALRDKSDVFAIPALNRDISTFDQMASALHYHMFQLVIVANNGLFGGSNAYAPYKEVYERQMFHLHGQPQASIAFVDIDNIGGFLRRKTDAKVQNNNTDKQRTNQGMWKFPPAGI